MRRGPAPDAAPVATPRDPLGQPPSAGRAAGDCSRCSSAGWRDDEASQSNLPVPCFQPTPGGRGHARQHKRKASLGGGSGLGSPCGRRRSTEVADALCEAGLADSPRREPPAEAATFSSCSAFQGGSDQRGSCSESEGAGPWQAGFVREGSCSGASSRGSRLRGQAVDKRRQSRSPAQAQPKQEWHGSVAELEAHGSTDPPAAQGSGPLQFPAIPAAQASPAKPQAAMPAGQAGARLGRRRSSGGAGSSSRTRTSRFMGVGSSNRKNQWQARILVHGKVTHLGYYDSEEAAARVYDRVALSLHGPGSATNFPASQYAAGGRELRGLGREDLQRALGVRPMDKSSQFRGVSRKKGKWEAKVMVNRRWAFRQLFDDEREAARAYDAAVRRLKPREAAAFVNFGPGGAPGPGAAAGRGGKKARGRAQSVRFSADAGQPLATAASVAALPPSLSLPAHLGDVRTTPLAPDDLACSSLAGVSSGLAPASELSPQHSALCRQTSFPVPGAPLPLSLPDPNSIGVPPPSLQLPFLELAASTCDSLQQQQQPVRALCEGLPPVPPLLPQLPSCSLALPPPVPTVDLPTIPPPLLPAEASRLSRAISASSLAACTQLPNPFQDACASLPLPLPAHASCSSGFRGLAAEPPRPLSALASEGSAALSRAASESVLRSLEGLSQPLAVLPRVQSYGTDCGSGGLQLPMGPASTPLASAGRPPHAPIPPSVFGSFAPPPVLQQQLQQQQPRQGSLPLAAAALPRAPSAASTRTLAGEQLTTQLSASSHQIAACLQPAPNAAAPLLPPPQAHPLPPYSEACVSLPFSAPLAHGFAGLPAMHPLALTDLQAKGCDADMAGLREDAAEIMAQLGVDVREGEAPPPLASVHIGGEDLSCLFPAP